MRVSLTAVLVCLALSLVGSSVVHGADAVTKCGAAQLKAYGALQKAYIAEATRACVAGSAGNPQPVDVATLTAAADKANTAFQAAIDKYGLQSCFFKSGTDVNTVVDVATASARELCLVIPTPTPKP